MLSCVLILPDDQLATGSAVGEAMGWGPNNFSVALSADGSEPATHWGLHAWVSEAFQAMIETGVYPPEVADAGITKADYDAVMAGLIYSIRGTYENHFAEIVAANGLQIAESE